MTAPVQVLRNVSGLATHGLQPFAAESEQAVCIVGTRDGVIVSVSATTAARLGHDAARLEGRRLGRIVTPNHRLALAVHLARGVPVEGLQVALVDACGDRWSFVCTLTFVADRFLLIGRDDAPHLAVPTQFAERPAPPAPEPDSPHVAAVREEERHRLSRDLHDGAQQALLAVGLELELAAEQVSERPDVQARLRELRTHVNDALDAIVELCRGGSPSLLSAGGLEPALADVVGRAAADVHFACRGVVRYAPEIEIAVYFSCVEAFQNALKHAGASRISIVVVDRDGVLRFRVSDDGCGHDPGRPASGTGLRNIAERVEGVGGRASIRSAPGRGTTVSATIPSARAALPPAATLQSSVSSGTA